MERRWECSPEAADLVGSAQSPGGGSPQGHQCSDRPQACSHYFKSPRTCQLAAVDCVRSTLGRQALHVFVGISSTQIYKVAEAAIATLAKASPGQQEIDEQPTGGISRKPSRLDSCFGKHRFASSAAFFWNAFSPRVLKETRDFGITYLGKVQVENADSPEERGDLKADHIVCFSSQGFNGL